MQWHSTVIDIESDTGLIQAHTRIEKAYQWRGMIESTVTRKMALIISSDPAVAQLFPKEKAAAADAKKIGELRT